MQINGVWVSSLVCSAKVTHLGAGLQPSSRVVDQIGSKYLMSGVRPVGAGAVVCCKCVIVVCSHSWKSLLCSLYSLWNWLVVAWSLHLGQL